MEQCNNCMRGRKKKELDMYNVCDDCRTHPLFDCRKSIPIDRSHNPWPDRYKALAFKYFGSSDVSLVK